MGFLAQRVMVVLKHCLILCIWVLQRVLFRQYCSKDERQVFIFSGRSTCSIFIIIKINQKVRQQMQSVKNVCADLGVWLVRLEIGYKFLLILAVACQLAGVLVEGWSEAMVFNAVKVIDEYQLWRLFSSFLVVYEIAPIPLIVTLFTLWVCCICMPSLEKRYSTIYIILEVIKQTFVMNMYITIIFYPLILLDLIQGDQIFTGGPIYTMLIVLFLDCCTEPDGKFAICGVTFFLPKRYLPILVLLACFFFFRANILMFGFIILLEVYQFGCRSKPLFALPVCTYLKINNCLPGCLRKLRGWVDCEGVRDNLEAICSQGCKEEENERENMVNSEVIVDRKQIKHTGQAEYKHHWLNKEVNEPEVQEPEMREEPKREIKEIVQVKYEEQPQKIDDYRDIWKSKSEEEPELDDQEEKQKPPLISSTQQENSQNLLSSQYNPPEPQTQQQLKDEQQEQQEQRPEQVAPQSISAVLDDDEQWA